MKALKQNKVHLFFSVIIALAIVFNACETEETPTAPEIPDISTFQMDFSDFQGDPGTNKMETYQNWTYSAVHVGVWNLIVTLGMAVPVVSFVEAFNHEPVYHPDNQTFTWSYNFNVLLTPFEAELAAWFEGDSIHWRMNMTQGQAYSDFTWYTGVSHINGSGGYWILNEKPLNPNALLKIDWAKENSEVGSIKYTNIIPEGPENGGYIHYGLVDGDLDAFYNIYNKGADKMVNIEWNREFKNGRVKSEADFLDNLWHCWDTTLADIECN